MIAQLVNYSTFNLLGLLLPLLVTVFSIPIIVDLLGIEQFGFFSLSIVLINYFGVFDFGLGKATTRFMKISSQDNITQNRIFWSSIILSILIGFIFLITTILLNKYFSIFNLFNITNQLKIEFNRTFYLIVFCIPILMVGNIVVGALESKNAFKEINIIHVISESITRIIPVIILYFTSSVFYIIFWIMIGKILSIFIYLLICFRLIPGLLNNFTFNKNILVKLVNYGKWLTLSSIIGPIMNYMDRFIIGIFISLKHVTYYTIPFDLIRKVQAIPLSISRAIFPTLTKFKSYNSYNIYKNTTLILFLLMAPIILFILLFSTDILQIWLGNEFAEKSSLILQVIVVGLYINSVSKPAFTLIQAIGRTDITAKAHLIELPIYLITLYFLIKYFGLIGIASAWAIRALIDRYILFVYADKLSQNKEKSNSYLYVDFLIIIFLTLSIYITSNLLFIGKIGYFLIFILTQYLIIYFFILGDNEKLIINAILKGNYAK